MKYAMIITVLALALVVILRIGSGRHEIRQPATIINAHENKLAVDVRPADSFLTPSRATLDFESRAEQVIQARYEQHVNKSQVKMTGAEIVAHVQVGITKNYGPPLPGTSMSDYLGHVDITLENPSLNRQQIITLQCNVDKVVPGPFSSKGDATTGYLWGCDQEGPLGTITPWRESGHIDQ